MFNFKQKRIVAQKKAFRRNKKVVEMKNIMIISMLSKPMLEERHNIEGLERFYLKEIEVSQKFFDDIEYANEIFISVDDESIKKEIVDFDHYFEHDVDLKLHFYDEKKNILYFELQDIACFERMDNSPNQDDAPF